MSLPLAIWYPLIMTLAVVASAVAARYTQRDSRLNPIQRWFIGIWGFVGAVVLAKLPFFLFPDEVLHHAGSPLGGKTVLFGLVGGYVGVEIAKWYLEIKIKTGDSFAVPVALGIGIGRISCLVGGCCCGTPTSLPWGIQFAGESFSRHPTQLYEMVFHFVAAAGLAICLKWKLYQNQLIKLYFLSYFVYRFMTEFIRPEIRLAFDLTLYQWAILAFAPIFIRQWLIDSPIRTLG